MPSTPQPAPAAARPRRIPGTLPLGSLAGIPVGVHWTFPLLLIWIAFSFWADGIGAVAYMTALVLVVFGCVVLHELGHAVAARRFGIRTRDITLFPIGGVARLMGMPEKPGQEIIVALAGPAVNLVIAGALVAGLTIGAGLPSADQLDPTADFGFAPFLWHIASINIFLLIFNLIPAFPMDGGRVLRALLATSMDRATATRAAAIVGRIIAVAFIIAPLVLPISPLLILIGLFVFFGGAAEAAAVTTQQALAGLRVHDAMMREFEVLDADADLAHAAERLLAGSQREFPVADGEQIIGLIDRESITDAIARLGESAPIRAALRDGVVGVEPSMPVGPAIERMRAGGQRAAPVIAEGRLVGLLTLENVEELIGVRRAARRRTPSAA